MCSSILVAFANVIISLLRKIIPNRICIIIQLVVVAVLVTIVNKVLKASGIERTKKELRQADICLWLLDCSAPLEDEDAAYLRSVSAQEHIVLLNKADKTRVVTEDDIREIVPESSVIALSAKTGEGLDLLKEAILAIATGNGSLDAGLNVTARQLEEIRQALTAIFEAETAVSDGLGQDVAAGILGTARGSLERILGISCDDALLDAIFGRFCVGK